MANCLRTAVLQNILVNCVLPINGISEMYIISHGAFTATLDDTGTRLASITIPGAAKVVARVEGFGNALKANETIKTGDYSTGVMQSVIVPVQGNRNLAQLHGLLNGRFVVFTRNEDLQYRVYGYLQGLEASGVESSTDTNGNMVTVTLSTPENAGVEMPMGADVSVWNTLTGRLFT